MQQAAGLPHAPLGLSKSAASGWAKTPLPWMAQECLLKGQPACQDGRQHWKSQRRSDVLP